MLPLKLRVLKGFDRIIGHWVTRRVGRTRRVVPARGEGSRCDWEAAPVTSEGIERILIIRPGGIGDACLTFPMIRALKDFYRGATIDVLGEKRNVGVYGINDLVREVHRYDHHPFRTIRGMARTKYQIVIDTEQYHYLSSVVANYLRPDYLCGFDTLGRGRYQTHRVRYMEQIYEVYSFLSLANALTGQPIAFEPNKPFLEVDERWQRWAAEGLTACGDRSVAVIVPGASTPHKYWAPDRYAQVARWLIQREFLVVLLGGKDTIATAGVIAADNADGDVLNLAGQTSLAQTAGVVQRAKLYLSSDTGALHIAYGVGTPTVHMFGSGIIAKWAPAGDKYVVVNKNLPCSPCTRYGYTPPCPYNVACMDAIRVEDVQAAIEEVLGR